MFNEYLLNYGLLNKIYLPIINNQIIYVYMSDEKIKILLIEDDKMIVEMYNVKFEHEGFAVSTAETGKDGLEKALAELPDIILLDIIMPEVDGLNVLRSLKQNAVTEKVPVIMLTNLNQEGDVKHAFELGATDYLVKAEFTQAQVVGKIKSYIKVSAH